MKILACSDFSSYNGFKEIFDKNRPDLLLLAGDLISDGRARFWSKAVELIPDFQEKKENLMTSFGITKRGRLYKGRNTQAFFDQLFKLEDEYRKTPEFNNIRKTIHVEEFFKSLKHASHSRILVVKGDHDDDFEGDYNVERINSIRNCYEISGKSGTFHGIRILGLGYYETHYLRTLRPLISEMKDRADIVLTHAEQRRLPLISQIRPKLIVRGHFGLGRYKVNEVSVVSPGFPDCYAIIETEGRVIRKIDSWFYCEKAEKWENCNLSCYYKDRIIEIHKLRWPWLEREFVRCPFE